MADKVPSLKLSNGKSIPQLGLGTWLSKPGEVAQAVKDAIDVGYRHFDCAFAYENEKEVGEAIKAKIKEGVVKREDLFITSKLWCTFHPKEMVVPALKKSLESFGLDYVDLYLIHWPVALKDGADKLFPVDDQGQFILSDTDYVDSWYGMEEACSLGLTKSIGLSNFNSEQVEKVMAVAKIKPVMNQVECHPYLNQRRLLDFCKSKGISITAYSPFANPTRPGAVTGEKTVLEDEKIKEIAAKYNKTAAHVVIRYQLQRGVVVIPKSVTKSRIESNFNVFDFTLSEEDMKELDNLDSNLRYLLFSQISKHKYYPFNIDF